MRTLALVAALLALGGCKLNTSDSEQKPEWIDCNPLTTYDEGGEITNVVIAARYRIISASPLTIEYDGGLGRPDKGVMTAHRVECGMGSSR